MHFLIMSSIIIGIIFYGPYPRLKEIYVTTAMTTYTHQYLAKIFLSDAEIQEIMDKYKVPEPTESTDIEEIEMPAQTFSPDIELVNISGKSFKGYMLIISDPSRVSIATSDNLGKRGMKVLDIVKSNNAVAGINAGGFADANGHGTGGTPQGVLIRDGKILHMSNASSHTIIGFDSNHRLVLGKHSPKEIRNMDLRDAVTFKPFLIINGNPQITSGDGGWGYAPRTAIGQRTDGTVLLLAIDGRQIGSLGASLKNVQDIMLEYGAHNASNLDGGSSTTLVYNNEIINKPSSSAGPRFVPSAFIVK